jgi:4-hydroxy-2-oxoheptanedioate aldolase
MVGRVSSLRARLRRGPALIGTFLKVPGTDALRTVAGAGFDLVIVDLEHSQLSEAQARELVAAADMLGVPSSVRIPEHDRGAVNRFLEAGADAIQLSSVRSAAQVEALMSDTRYSPGGGRSISLAHAAAGYGRRGLADHLGRMADEPPLVIAQVEQMATEAPAAIAAAGADVIFLGSTDLLVDAGLDAVAAKGRGDEILAAAEARGVARGSFAATGEQARELAARGVTYIALGSDLAMLAGAADAAVASAREPTGA